MHTTKARITLKICYPSEFQMPHPQVVDTRLPRKDQTPGLSINWKMMQVGNASGKKDAHAMVVADVNA